ncbi:MAG: carboxypeptidase regulatory-like domain-containing protein [Planctomycetes bacterium]|nr:carboxypeptidase regulatory-like domain-containing protein [Planctomycetota bacterium]
MGARKVRALSVVLAALLAALWWMARAHERAPGADAPMQGAESSPSGTRAPGALLHATPRSVSAPERVPASPGAAPDSPSGLLRVRVVLASDGRPLPGVEVLYFDSGAGDRLEYEEFVREVDESLEAVVACCGRTYRSDARGVAEVPFPRGSGSVGALHEGNWAQEWIVPSSPDEVVLALDAEVGFDVRVLDARGAAVSGASVALLERWQESESYARRLERTNERGLAHFGHLGSFQLGKTRIPPRLAELFVCARVLVPVPACLALDVEAWPREEIVFTLPEAGRVTLELVGADGEPWTEQAHVKLDYSHTQRAWLVGQGRTVLGQPLEERANQGVAVFEHVGLGLALVATSHADGRAAVVSEFAGPTRADEDVRLRIELAAPTPLVRGRLLDAEDHALASRTVKAELWSAGAGIPTVQRRRTDERGRFSGFGGEELDGPRGWRILLALEGDEQRSALRDLPFPVPAGTIDLGDVVLDAPPFLASGRVVDEERRPLRAVEVRVEEENKWQSTARWIAYERLPGARMLTGADGRFELRAESSAPLRLCAERAGFVGSATAFEAPRTDWTIVLRRAGAIAGTVRLAPGLPAELVRLSATREDPPARVLEVRLLDDGSFRIDGLDSGNYTVNAALWHNLPGQHSWPGIVVHAGETTTLAPLELDVFAHCLRFDVRDASAASVPGVLLAWRAKPDAPLGDVPPVRDAGETLFPTLTLPIPRVRVSAPGFRALELADVAADQRVVLERGPRVRLELAGGLPHLPEHWTLLARVLGADEREFAATFDAGGRAQLLLGEAGPFSVTLWLQLRAERGMHGVNGLPWSIDVADSAEEQSFVSPPFTREFLDDLERQTR